MRPVSRTVFARSRCCCCCAGPASSSPSIPRVSGVDLVDLSRSLGLGVRPDADDLGHHAPHRRTTERLVGFRTASWWGEDPLAIHAKLPALERHGLAHLPERVQTSHHRLVTDHLDGLVALAEGRELEPAGPGWTAQASSVARQESNGGRLPARLRSPAVVEPRIAAR